MGPIGVALLVMGASLLTTSGMSSFTKHLKDREEYFRKKAEEAEREEKEREKSKD